MISRAINPIARIKMIGRPKPRRGASSVREPRPGVPEPEAVTGSLQTSEKVDRSIAEGPPGAPAREHGPERWTSLAAGLFLVLVALVVYAASNPVHWNTYDHFVWQADAFLHGRAWFAYPVEGVPGLPDNWYFQDVYPISAPTAESLGHVLLPFPPLPALVLLPFVAVWGLAADQAAVAVGLAAAGVGIAWWMLGGLRLRLGVRSAAVLVFAGGTAWWWAAAAGSTWYFAHLVAVDLALLAVGVTLRHDRHAAGRAREDDRGGAGAVDAVPPAPSARPRGLPRRIAGAAWPPDRWQLLAGLLLGLAVAARLPLVFAAPWFMLVGGGRTVARRTLSTGLGAALPVAALLAYTYLTTGAFLHPGYDYQYQAEAQGYPTLGYHPAWSIEDVRYIPQNLRIMLGSLPEVAPTVKPDTLGIAAPMPLCQAGDTQRSLFDPGCPIAIPVDLGTSLVLSAPGLLLVLLAYRRRWRSRLAAGGTATIVLIAVFNLAHFSQGWVQWGYRFSLDFIPFALPLVALGAARADGRLRTVAIGLVLAGTLVNLWGVTWGKVLGW
jgi:hypothetical protein